tara:strand:+ start:104 stop:355 length:252 start_codon:yes stop_codon:yes gene_type:complete
MNPKVDEVFHIDARNRMRHGSDAPYTLLKLGDIWVERDCESPTNVAQTHAVDWQSVAKAWERTALMLSGSVPWYHQAKRSRLR